jgi:hypothetical protein
LTTRLVRPALHAILEAIERVENGRAIAGRAASRAPRRRARRIRTQGDDEQIARNPKSYTGSI